MRHWALFICILASVLTLGGIAGGAPRMDNHADGDRLDMYTTVISYEQLTQLVQAGYDIAADRVVANGVEVDLVLSGGERNKLLQQGFQLQLKRNQDGKTPAELAAEQAVDGYTVWRSYDQPGGIRDEMYQLARENPQLVKLVVIGHSIQGREIIALKVTQGARGADGRRPAVLYSSLQHAREWISVEVNRRLLRYFINGYYTDPAIKELLKERELWFVLVANPDGYQYTFDAERLWRKNLRDNDGDGKITSADGVDPNRNFAEHWGYDNEGSSPVPSSETYRGTGPASEPETQALQGLMKRIRFKFLVNYHSYGQLLLYSFGWQVQTPSIDDPIFVALSGTDEKPAIPGYNPGVGADLYTTNGETTDYAHAEAQTLAWTPELGEGIPGSGFVFPDNEELVQREFEINLPFALDVATSALDPSKPVSHLGNTVKPFYVDSFDVSYGDPQEVRVNAARSLGKVVMKYQINNGPVQTSSTSEWNGGKRFGDVGDVYRRIMRGRVVGTKPGDSVKVWFEGGGAVSESFTYTAKVESRAPVLVLAAEDYTGISPVQTPELHYLSHYTATLEANHISYDVYDVDANGRKAPDALGVLSHYKAVIWYTGDDVITREPGMVNGTASRLANDLMLEVRAYLNEDGRLLYTGKYAGSQYVGGYRYDPVANLPCGVDPTVNRRCVTLSNDFLQYYLGAYIYNDNAGTSTSGQLFDVVGTHLPFIWLKWGFGPPGTSNQDHSASFIATSGILPDDIFPQFTSVASAKYDRPGGPYEPHSGSYYLYSQMADRSYKRITRTIDVPISGATLSFWVSRNSEQDWDFVFVEAHTAGQDDWTTLPDKNGHTSSAPGRSCSSGWRRLHPFLDHYQTQNPDRTCSPTGTTGAWNAATGKSVGWEQWSVDLGAYAGKQVEVAIAYASDWNTQGLGVFIDDIVVSTGTGSTSFESGLDGWAVSGPPPGSAPNSNSFTRMTADGFPEGAAISTEDTIYLGFGLEGIADANTRNKVMQRAMLYLLR